MKKRIIALILAIGTIFSFSACGEKGDEDKTSGFIELNQEETLFVGDDYMARNYEVKKITPQYLTYDVELNYTLQRSSSQYNISTPYFAYNGYYYYWDTERVQDQLLLGDMTETTSYMYSYLPYGNNNVNVVVKKVTKTEYSYDYSGGDFITKERAVYVQLNNYFADWDTLQNEANGLVEMIDITRNKKYYVDTINPTQIKVSTSQYVNTYFYIE